jgi:hypothetical protein
MTSPTTHHSTLQRQTVKAFLHIITYAPGQEQSLEPGYLALDNQDNPRPDWREYWPIRRFLLSTPLDEDAYYGFLSPRFREKTGLGPEDINNFIRSTPERTDVAIFSPQVDVGAFFPNVFIGEEMADPGFLDTCEAFVERIGMELDVRRVLMDSTNIVFSNYIVARPAFWRAWLDITERMFSIAEFGENDDPLRQQLLHRTQYREGVPRKVFLLERVASMLLCCRPDIQVRAHNPFRLAWSTQLNRFRQEAIVCDALKIASQVTGYSEYGQAYETIRGNVILSALGKGQRELLNGDMPVEAFNADIARLLPPHLPRVAQLSSKQSELALRYQSQSTECEWRSFDVSKELPEDAGVFDAWILEDTLETASDPQRLLSRIKKHLTPHGIVIACFMNAQHWLRISRLCLGKETSSTNAPHQRNFCKTEIDALIREVGYEVTGGVARIFSPTEAAPFIEQIRTIARISGENEEEVVKAAGIWQYVILLTPSPR